MSLAGTLDAPLRGTADVTLTGSSVSTEVPGRFDVALDGHAYIIDYAADLQGFRGEHFARSSVPILRNQADTAQVPAEQSINRESLWRRSQESWHHGSGQVYYDRADSDSQRFYTSKGVDVWSKWKLSLLNDTSLVRASGQTNLRLTAAGDYTYLADGNDLAWSSNIATGSPSFTTVSGTPGTACNWITSDGFTVYAAYAGAIYSTTRGAGSASSFSSLANVTVLGYVKGRLMAAAGPSIYNIIAPGAAPTALLTHANSDFRWVGFAEGPGYMYAAGYSGTKSLIYKIAVTADGTALSAPIVTGELPTGETVRTIKGYLGLVLVGTDYGFRIAVSDSQGNLTFGSLIPTTSPVLNFEPSDRFVYYGLTNYDGTSTGLGRIDLSQFNQPLTPAYATDLMAEAQGSVASISSAGTRRVFAVSGAGFYLETSSPVATGAMRTGRITYGVGDDKVAMYLDLRHQPLAGSVDVRLTANDTSTTDIGSSATPGSVSSQYALSAQQTRAEFFDLTLTLSADVLSPVVTRTTLRAYPAPSRSFKSTVPLLLHSTINDRGDSAATVDVVAERAFLESLVVTQRLVTYQEGSQSRSVVVEDCDWIPVKGGPPNQFGSFDGTFVVMLKEQSQ